MGDIKKLKKKYSKPGHPWQKIRIEEENTLVKQYGLKNKTEIWRMRSKLKTFSDQAKRLIAARGAQADLEKNQMMQRLARLGLLKENATLDEVLGLTINDVLNRRLQTIVFKKGFARSMRQARQFIAHEHVLVSNKKITSPSYLVSVIEESSITFSSKSSLSSVEHPERAMIEKKPVIVGDKNEKRR